MNASLTFEPEAWYGEYTLLLNGMFTSESLRVARKSEALRYSEPQRGKRFYKGEWLTAWLGASAVPARHVADGVPIAEVPRRRSERWPFPDE